MSYTFYSSLHLLSLFSLALILGCLWGLYTQPGYNPKIRSLLLSLHGVFMFFILLAGFGLIAKIQLDFPWPAWIYLKLIVWLALGAAPFLIKKTGLRFSSNPVRHKLSLALMFCLFLAAVFFVKLKL